MILAQKISKVLPLPVVANELKNIRTAQLVLLVHPPPPQRPTRAVFRHPNPCAKRHIKL